MPLTEENKENLVGTEWATADGHYVKIYGRLSTVWLGELTMCGKQIITLWWQNYDHFNCKDLNLVQRKVGVEDRDFECLITKK